jgi:predicted transport protein
MEKKYGTQIILDEDVFKELIERSITGNAEKKLLLWAIHSDELKQQDIELNDLIRGFLGINKHQIDTSNNYPSSKDSKIQHLLDELRSTIFKISSSGLERKRKKWVANPNVVTITVQDARAKNLRITVYGKPEEFEGVKDLINIESDMAGYSRFVINNTNQLTTAIKIIEHSYMLKKARGRL